MLSIMCIGFFALASAKPISIARDLQIDKNVQVGGAVQASTLTVNGTLTGTSIDVSATLETGTIRSNTVYTDVLSAKSGDTILVEGNLEMVGSSSTPTPPISFLATSVVIDGIKQWSLFSSENFDDQNIGAWKTNDLHVDQQTLSTTTCSHPTDFFLGGACVLSSGTVVKTFRGLPAHKQIRIKATLNFIDQWQGEQVWCKLNGNYVWLDTIGHPALEKPASLTAAVARNTKETSAMSVCGNSDHADIALGTLVDVTKRDDKDSVTIEFGTTVGKGIDACSQSWGVDDVQIYIR